MAWLTRVVLLASVAAATPATAQSVTSPWVDHGRAKSRLVATGVWDDLIVFVEIEMPPGWKTYWRNPGDAGGLPPSFDTSKSENVGGAEVLYPAPSRLVDAAGETIGYKEHARFPVKFAVADKTRSVIVRIGAHFGVCKEICVPLEANYELTVAPGTTGPAEGALLQTLERVPLPMSSAQSSDPRLAGAEVHSYDAPASVTFRASYPGGSEGADLFVEAPEGLYVPMPKRVRTDGDSVEFEATFSSAAELQQILGKSLRVTMVGPGGQSEAVTVIQ